MKSRYLNRYSGNTTDSKSFGSSAGEGEMFFHTISTSRTTPSSTQPSIKFSKPTGSFSEVKDSRNVMLTISYSFGLTTGIARN